MTRAQAQKFNDMLNLADSFLVSDSTPVEGTLSVEPEIKHDSTSEPKIPLTVSREQLIKAQQGDRTLTESIKAADLGQMSLSGVMYFWDDGLLMCRWEPDSDDEDCQEVRQIVLPVGIRADVLRLAHEYVMSGHLGVTKTFYRISRYFYWPGVKADVSAFCKACRKAKPEGSSCAA